MSENGTQPATMEVAPQALIDALMQRVHQLTAENVMLQAALAQLRGAATEQGQPEGATG